MATAPAGTSETPRRTRAANKPKMYDVFKQDAVTGAFMRVAEDIETTERGDLNRRLDAIATATADMDEDEKVGTFGTCPAGMFVVNTRQRKAEPVDLWS